MITITNMASELLKEKLLNVYMTAGGMDSPPLDSQTKEIIKESLLQNCLETGLGFRLQLVNDERGHISLINLKIDSVQEGDDVCKEEGIMVFINHDSASLLEDSEIDYIDSCNGSFTLRQCNSGVITG